MRRVTLILAAVAMMVSLFAVVAYAAEIRGTGNSETLVETQNNGANDKIVGHRGEDIINANEFTDDTDKVKGNRQNDTINVEDGDPNDTANGGPGTDTCFVDTAAPPAESDEFKSCESIR
jgi:RTX calcium-binding nonapeptide repeat (4 copies)